METPGNQSVRSCEDVGARTDVLQNTRLGGGGFREHMNVYAAGVNVSVKKQYKAEEFGWNQGDPFLDPSSSVPPWNAGQQTPLRNFGWTTATVWQ